MRSFNKFFIMINMGIRNLFAPRLGAYSTTSTQTSTSRPCELVPYMITWCSKDIDESYEVDNVGCLHIKDTIVKRVGQ